MNTSSRSSSPSPERPDDTMGRRNALKTRLRILVVAIIGVLLIAYFYPTRPQSSSLSIPEVAEPVQWHPCGDGMDCGNIAVPKDYFNATSGTASIAVVRKRATKSPKKGTIFLNPGLLLLALIAWSQLKVKHLGGPGGSGAMLAKGAGDMLAAILGDHWDLVGFDPRGVRSTEPRVNCISNAATLHMLTTNTVLQQGITVPNIDDLSDPRNYWALLEQYRQLLAVKKTQMSLCEQNMDVDDLKFMGTANVVRDLDYMTQLLDGPDAKINFWGISYGSIIGTYLVNMLPHRVGYVTIDGIVDPIVWSSKPSHLWHRGWVVDAEETYQWFLRDCSKAGPELCPITRRKDEPPSAIQERIENFIASLVEEPLTISDGVQPGYLTAGGARGIIYMGLMIPRLWPVIADALASAMKPQSNGTDLFSFIAQAPDEDNGNDLARFGVTCADSPLTGRVTPEELAKEALTGLQESSIHFALSPLLTDPDGGCQFWPVKGQMPERFTGPWNATLERPMLIISNTADPITPLASGLVVNQNMPSSSTIVIQKGPGHTSIFAPSICTLKAVKGYFAGITPTNGTICELTAKTFYSSEEEDGREDLPTDSDRALFDAARQLGRYFTGGR